MAWSSSSSQPKLRLKGGDECPSCHKKMLCLNGLVARPGSQIVTCQNCREAFCAVCGGKAQVQTDRGEQKYFCPVCDKKH